jgi:hypothetical protein
MTQVDIDDDSITRYIVWHYRFDNETRHYKKIPIAAFSKPREAKKIFNQESDRLRKRKESGLADEREYISSDQKTAGHKGRARELRMFLRRVRQK